MTYGVGVPYDSSGAMKRADQEIATTSATSVGVSCGVVDAVITRRSPSTSRTQQRITDPVLPKP